MTKAEMIKKVSGVSGYPQKDVDAIISAFASVVVNTLTENRDEKIALPNIGTFSVKNVPERKGVSTLGEKKEWVKPAHDEITFKISRGIKELS